MRARALLTNMDLGPPWLLGKSL